MRTRKTTIPTPDSVHCKCTNINDSELSEWHTLYINIWKSDTSIQTPLYLGAWVEGKNLKKTFFFLWLSTQCISFLAFFLSLPLAIQVQKMVGAFCLELLAMRLWSIPPPPAIVNLISTWHPSWTQMEFVFLFAFAFAYTVYSLAGSLA